MKNLTDLKQNEVATISCISDNCQIKRRLFDMGFIENEKVKCLYKSPFGSPIAYSVCGAVIALRKVDASKIGVVL